MNNLIKLDVKHKIHTIRGVQVILDDDLAELYDVEIRVLNQAVKRNIERFPDNFMFRLSKEEFDMLSKEIVSKYSFLRSQNVTLKTSRGAHRKYLPYAFTEQGVSMLSGVLRSKTAVNVSISIINAFVDMRKFISSNASVFTRLDVVERKQMTFEVATEKNFKKVFKALHNDEVKQNIFYDGQVFDAYKFVSKLIKSAKKNIILVDNYIDESVLTLFSKRKNAVKVTIYSKNITKQLKLDIEKFNLQYDSIILKEFKNSHDRFLIIDGQIYHFGASLKDLGKKWFACSKLDKDAFKMLEKLK